MSKLYHFIDSTFIGLGRQFKLSYLPPLMIYLAAGVAGLTGIVGTFFCQRLSQLICCISRRPWFLGWNSMGLKNATRSFS